MLHYSEILELAENRPYIKALYKQERTADRQSQSQTLNYLELTQDQIIVQVF